MFRFRHNDLDLLRATAVNGGGPDDKMSQHRRHTLSTAFGTFLQTLPDLVKPLKGHSLSPRSCPATRSAPSERFGY